MKKYIFAIIKILVFVIGFAAAFYYFMPWREVGNFAMSVASSRLERNGLRTGWSDVVGEDGGFTVNNLALRGVVNVSCESVTIKPNFASSVLSLAGVCELRFRGLKIMLGQSFSLGDGSVLLSASPSEILFEQLRTRGGDIMLNGDVAINPSEMKISRAEASVNVSSALEGSLGVLQNFLPLVNEGGRWYLRR